MGVKEMSGLVKEAIGPDQLEGLEIEVNWRPSYKPNNHAEKPQRMQYSFDVVFVPLWQIEPCLILTLTNPNSHCNGYFDVHQMMSIISLINGSKSD